MLNKNTIHVWRSNWQALAQQNTLWRAFLSQDEITRAERYHLLEHTNRFLVTRRLLRILIGRYLEQPPQAVQFHYTAAGKPTIDAPLYFSLSHAGDWVVIAFTTISPRIGIDIENITQNINMESVVRHYFADSEISAWQNLSPHIQRHAFFRLWTSKEAFLKAIGVGLGISTKIVQVALGDETRFLSLPDDYSLRDWHLYTLNLPDDYLGALAIDRTISHIQYFDWYPS